MLRQQLLDWWEARGRRRIDHKPWMFTPDGRWPDPGEEVCCLGAWIAEVMLQVSLFACKAHGSR
jgi:A/G-specific adenine glycosylase